MLFPKWTGFQVSLTTYIILAIITSITSTYGDLAESMIKRNLQIKDTGTALPGHGGFLDRFDSLILATPFVWLFLKIVLKA